MKDYDKFKVYDTKKQTYDVLSIMTVNLGELKQFCELTKDLVKNAYNLAQISSVAGIVLIATSILIALVFNNNQIALITAIGGIIIEAVKKTFLVVYQKTLSQLNYYYASLHYNERLLSLIYIADNTNIRDELYKKIIECELGNLKKHKMEIDKIQF